MLTRHRPRDLTDRQQELKALEHTYKVDQERTFIDKTVLIPERNHARKRDRKNRSVKTDKNKKGKTTASQHT